MEIGYYEQFLRFKAIHLRSEAKQSLQKFIDSFVSFAEKEQWTRRFLDTEEYEQGHKIRHELYAEVVFPVLLNGYQKREVWAIFWLARTAQNLYKASYLHQQIGFRTERGLLKECYALDPENFEVQQDLLSSGIRWLDFCIHEYPAVILYGMDGASVDECQKILSEVEFLRKLDSDQTEAKFFDEVQEMVIEYCDRLQKNQE